MVLKYPKPTKIEYWSDIREHYIFLNILQRPIIYHMLTI